MDINLKITIQFSAALEALAQSMAGRPVAPGAAHAPPPEAAPVIEDAVEAQAPAKNKGGRPRKDAQGADPTKSSAAQPAEEAPSSSDAEEVASGATAAAPEITKQMVQDQMSEYLKTNDGLSARQKVIDNADGATSISNADPKFYPVLFEAFGGKLPEAA